MSRNRPGHLFQGRFSSAAVEDVRYLLTVVRYVHDNPVKAGVSGRECYQWSSYRGYVENKGFVSRGLVYELIGGAARFGHVEDRGFVSRGLVYELIGGAVRFVEFSSSEDSWRDLARVMHSDGVGVLEVARTALGGRDPLVIGASPRPERDACIRILSECGLNASEISRITGVSRRVISRVAGQN